MDYIYTQLTKGLVEINRIKEVNLKLCKKDGCPLPELKVGDLYLEITVVDSDRVVLSDFSQINDFFNQLKTDYTEGLEAESARVNSMISQLNENITKIVDQLNSNISAITTQLNQNLLNEQAIREQADKELDSKFTDSLNKETQRVNSMIDQLNSNIQTIVEELNKNIASIVGVINTNVDNESKERLRQDNILDERITTLSNQTTSSLSTLTDRIAAEEVRASTEETNLDKEIKAEASERLQADNTLSTNLANEITRATNAENTLSTNLTSLQATVSNNFTTLSNTIKQEEQARSEADNSLSQRIDNLEGKTTRLYYGEGTLSSPTATEIQSFISGLEVDPPYEAPYSGIAVVVKLTDEGTYHIWHYYSNLSAWKDDGVDLVNTFTNEVRGIIQGSTKDGFVRAENGLGKVSGWEKVGQLQEDIQYINKSDKSLATLSYEEVV